MLKRRGIVTPVRIRDPQMGELGGEHHPSIFGPRSRSDSSRL